jgi:hypothetical protein
MRDMHKIPKETTMKDVRRNVPRIYSTLEKVDHQSHMIEVKGNITNQPICNFN